MSEHELQQSNVEAYALGALDADERMDFETHLMGCSECRDDLATYVPLLHELRTISSPIPPALSRPKRTSFLNLNALYPIAAVLLLGIGTFGGFAYEHSQTDDMVAVASMAASSAKEVRLTGMHVDGRALVGAERRRTAFVLTGLPPPPRGQTYQVWVRSGSTISPGTLHRNREGYEVLVVPGDLLDNATGVAVTVEPAGGSATISGNSVAQGDV